jgi:hypothetical protein
MKERNCYDRRTADFLKVVLEQMPDLSDDVMEGWIKNPDAVKKALENVFSPHQKKNSRFDTWKTISLGTGIKTLEDFQKILLYKPLKIQKSVYDIFLEPNFKVAPKKTELELVRVSLLDLGFNENLQGIQFDQVSYRAEELGLKPCPLEVGFQFILQTWDLDCENTVIVMKNNENFFVQRLDQKQEIDFEWISPGDVCRTTTRWIFCHPYK